jgi:hypothetical protein
MAEDLRKPGGPLLIAFSGFAHALPIPSFEFVGLSRDLDINRIFGRDLTQTWYLSGHAGISTTIDGTVAFLKRKIKEAAADRVVVFGNSVGGYAAILFGTMLNADVVHAFAPYSMIGDKRYVRNQATIEYVHQNFPDPYFDLRPVLQRAKRTGTINLYYDPELTIDSKQAMHLDGVPNVYHHALPGRGHELIRVLKDSGELKKILSASVEGSPHVLDMSVIPRGSQRKSPTLFARIWNRIFAGVERG